MWHLCEQSASGEGVVYKLYLAQYAHTLPTILPDVAHRLPDALGQNLFGLSALGERDLQSWKSAPLYKLKEKEKIKR